MGCGQKQVYLSVSQALLSKSPLP